MLHNFNKASAIRQMSSDFPPEYSGIQRSSWLPQWRQVLWLLTHHSYGAVGLRCFCWAAPFNFKYGTVFEGHTIPLWSHVCSTLFQKSYVGQIQVYEPQTCFHVRFRQKRLPPGNASIQNFTCLAFLWLYLDGFRKKKNTFSVWSKTKTASRRPLPVSFPLGIVITYTWMLQISKLPKHLLLSKSAHLLMINSSRADDWQRLTPTSSFKHCWKSCHLWKCSFWLQFC